MSQLPLQQFPQPVPAVDSLGQAVNQDLQNRVSAINRNVINSQLNNSALGATGNNVGPLNNTSPLSAVAINQTALNNSVLNAQNALNNSALNRSNLNRSNLSNQPARQAINTSVHNRSAYNNNLNNPIVQPTVIPAIPLNPHFDLNPPITATNKQQSTKLWFVFWAGALLVMIEMFTMLGRYHFLGLMAGLAVVALFALNLFSNSYNRLLLAIMFVSVAFDITWLVLKMRGQQYPSFYSPFATLHMLVNSAVIILLFISIIVRFVIFGLMCSFWSVQPERAFFIVVLNNEIVLNGGPIVPMGYGSNIYRPV